MFSPAIEKLIKIFSKFPTVGPRTATRFVFYLLNLSEQEVEELLNSIRELRSKTKYCLFCFKPFEGQGGLCEICKNYFSREPILCVVEKETDLAAIEEPKIYKGLYFILGGTVSHLRKKDLEKLRIEELLERIKNPEKFGLPIKFKEIILGNNLTTEGEATALYLEQKLKPLGLKITRLGRGLPIGGEIEYSDEETLKSALESRK